MAEGIKGGNARREATLAAGPYLSVPRTPFAACRPRTPTPVDVNDLMEKKQGTSERHRSTTNYQPPSSFGNAPRPRLDATLARDLQSPPWPPLLPVTSHRSPPADCAPPPAGPHYHRNPGSSPADQVCQGSPTAASTIKHRSPGP
ncbi:uncharacterized protein LOC144112875 [Amblyomma americanum]